MAQSGTYSIDELLHFQVFEMTCNSTNKICRREETRKGGGPVPAPAGGQSTAGASMLEVNGSKKQLVVSLPVHWATFNLSYHAWDEPILRTLRAAAAEHVEVVTPRVGEVVEVGQPFKNVEWYSNQGR